MATVRQLTTRFSFETDKSGLNSFTQALGGAKAALSALATTLGVVAAGGALVKAGNNLQRAAIQAGQFTDEVKRLKNGDVVLTGKLAEAWERIQKAVPGTETLGDFLNAFVKFRQSFKDAPLSDFTTLFEAAGNIARIEGKPLADVFDRLHQAVVSGDFQTFVDTLPAFDQMDANMQSFVKGLLEVDPTGTATVQQRLQRITELLNKANPQLRKTAELMVETTAEGQWDNLIDNIRDVTEKISGPMHNAVVALLKPVNDFFKEWREGGATLTAFIKVVEQRLGEDLPKVIKTSLAGVASILRDPEDISENLALGAGRFAENFLAGLDVIGRTIFPNSTRRAREIDTNLQLGGLDPSARFGPRTENDTNLRLGRGRPSVGFNPLAGSIDFSPTFNFNGVAGTLAEADSLAEQIRNTLSDWVRENSPFFQDTEGVDQTSL